jgi:ATP-dependent exoDNAse (exonuclease V) beta subunit
VTNNLKVADLYALDSLNRIRALEHTSFIVEAPAGAGKTELLTQRYLKLLATVNEPEEIIALTFTNKAAAEMRNRILLSLENAQHQTLETTAHKLVTRDLANAALAQSNAKTWDIIAQPSRLRILTIDALCSSLTRQMPLLSKFGGQPAVSDDTDSHYMEASRRAIAHIVHETKSDDTVTIALSYLDNNSEKLTGLLAKMLARRDQWLPHAVDLHGKEIEEVSKNTTIALKYLISESL